MSTLYRQNTGSLMLNLAGHTVTTEPWKFKHIHLLCIVTEVDFVNWRVESDGSNSRIGHATKTGVLSISLWTYFHFTIQARLFPVDLCAVWRLVNIVVCRLGKGEARVAVHYCQRRSLCYCVPIYKCRIRKFSMHSCICKFSTIWRLC